MCVFVLEISHQNTFIFALIMLLFAREELEPQSKHNGVIPQPAALAHADVDNMCQYKQECKLQ
jgi:hypothetical protein